MPRTAVLVTKSVGNSAFCAIFFSIFLHLFSIYRHNSATVVSPFHAKSIFRFLFSRCLRFYFQFVCFRPREKKKLRNRYAPNFKRLDEQQCNVDLFNFVAIKSKQRRCYASAFICRCQCFTHKIVDSFEICIWNTNESLKLSDRIEIGDWYCCCLWFSFGWIGNRIWNWHFHANNSSNARGRRLKI